ncbi:hypothetical protein [Halarcobacter sp.]|uniref:hypothetical protein n=1 Tax=Halarcobacter sp. TaxID=2321133 RepID=UPI0029F4D332|nr:hypothetical protein [Halarcobacter sp.]
MKLTILIAIIVSIFTGCAGSFPLYIHSDSNLKKKYVNINEPNLNIITTTEIGQNMYSKSYLYYDDTYDIKLKDIAIGKEGSIWVDSSASTKTSAGIKNQFEQKYIKKLRKVDNKFNAMCYTTWICLTDLNNDKEFTHFSAFGTPDYGKLNSPVKYEITQSTSFQEDSFKYIALYQGKKNNIIKISFREFKNNMARPAFTQDIEYELDKDGTALIGFKGLRIKVLKVTNFDITYKVIKDYD